MSDPREAADWTEQARRLVTGLSGMLGAAADSPGAERDCGWCPLCQFAAVLRGERPEVTAALADLLATASTALRNLAGQADATPGPATAGGAAAGETAPQQSDAAAAPPAVQRIEIT